MIQHRAPATINGENQVLPVTIKEEGYPLLGLETPQVTRGPLQVVMEPVLPTFLHHHRLLPL